MQRRCFRVAMACVLAWVTAVSAQPPQNSYPAPRLSTILPAGGKAGSTVEVVVTGTDIDIPADLRFSHSGITAVWLEPPEPKETPDPKSKKPAPKPKKPGPPPALKFQVTVKADVPPGIYDARLINRWGATQPRAFVVGTLAEVNETEPNNDVPEAQRVEIGTTVNGLISAATDVDFYKFRGSAGQRVLLSCLAATIDSRAGPYVEVYSADDRRLATNRAYRENDALADVTLPADGDYTVRVSEYAYTQGGPTSFYRLSIFSGSWIDAVMPPAVNPGKPATVTLLGRNLPGGKPAPGFRVNGKPLEELRISVTPPSDPKNATRLESVGYVSPTESLVDRFTHRLPDGTPVAIGLTDLPVVMESKDRENDTLKQAEAIMPPCEIAGRIDRSGDRDHFRFPARQGETLTLQLLGDQLGSPNDFVLKLQNQKGESLSPDLDDDNNFILHAQEFFNPTADPPAFRFTAPADGDYFIEVRAHDGQVSFGPRSVYRLRVSKPRPDFRAIVLPRLRDPQMSTLLPAGGSVTLSVLIQRRDDFNGPISITAKDLPPGVTASTGYVGSREKWGAIVLRANADAKEVTRPISLICEAEIEGQRITREARPASLSWPMPPNQNVPALSRLNRELLLSVRSYPQTLGLKLDPAKVVHVFKGPDGKDQQAKGPKKLVLQPGDKLTIPLEMVWTAKEARANVLTVQPEPTVPNVALSPVTINNNQPVSIPKDKSSAEITVNVKPNANPGHYAMIFRGETLVPFLREPDSKGKPANATASAVAEPLTYTVLPRTLGRVSAQLRGKAPKPGDTAEVFVKVDRQNDYDGPFQIRLEFPKESGLSAPEVTLPAGVSEVKVPVKVADNAKPGSVPSIRVETRAKWEGEYEILSETKLSLNIVK